MTRKEILASYIKEVQEALAHVKPTDWRSYSNIRLPVPGLLSKEVIDGVDVASLLVPQVTTPVHERADVVWNMLPTLGAPSLSDKERSHLRGTLSRQVMDFALFGSRPEERLARLLWAMGQDLDRVVSHNTLLIQGDGIDFGIKDGRLHGGPYDGLPVDLDLSQILYESTVVRVRAKEVIYMRRLMTDHKATGVFNKFCVLYAVSEWDRTVMLKTVLIPKPKNVRQEIEGIAANLMEVDDPYRFLYQALVPYQMAKPDFRAVFGRESNRGRLTKPRRLKLVNKLYSLPFFR